MGVPGLWPLCAEKGYKAQLKQGLSSSPPTPGSKFRVDLLASSYPQIRYHYLNDLSTFPQAIELHFISCELRKKTSDKRNTALAGAEDCIRNMEKSLEGGHSPCKPTFKKLMNKLRGAFYLGQDSRMVLVTYLRGQGWSLPEIASEADITIAHDFKPGDIVVSQDSDITAYENVETIWPLSRRRFLKYEMGAVAKHHLQLSRVQLTVLYCVSKNDYTTNLNQMGVRTNYGTIKTITEGDPQTMVRRYLAHEVVVIKKPDLDRFDPALKVFCRRELTIPDPPAAPHGLDADARLQELFQRLARIRDVTHDRRQQTFVNLIGEDFAFVASASEGNVDIPNRFRIADRPPEKPPPPTSPVGGIRSCFQHVVKQASEAARTLQCGIGMYLESLSAREVDDMDKLILRKLCPNFTVEKITAFNDWTNQQQSVGQRQDQEHDQGSQRKYNEQEPFLKMLLNAIMNSTQPGATANVRNPTANVELAREFFNRINLYGVSGPPTKPAYPASTIAQLVANQLYVELKNHYKNGSLVLCKKIEVLKKELLQVEATTGTIDLSMSAIQNVLENTWNAQLAKEQEFSLAAGRLLRMLGGSIGAKRQDDNFVIIGIGLGDFKSHYGLSSLHTAFCSYFVRLARSLGYIVRMMTLMTLSKIILHTVIIHSSISSGHYSTSVAASMVAHLEMEDAHRVFGLAVISELAPLVVDEQFVDADEALRSTLKTTTDAARDSNGYLDAQRVQLAKLSEHQVVARPKETESMTVRTWHQVFDLMFDGTIIFVLTGESGLSSTREE
ncbi:hypothetical protein KI688_004607 [Linnemannia hyalina]|uniref:Uncharacterized protein n=1 Tax=Linnemannia hyalina TaxID=64524 RepID=A0A9P7XLY3_9FUNG|nr:hypothetical protein KI688_004607 [Linnemannia hyalina]